MQFNKEFEPLLQNSTKNIPNSDPFRKKPTIQPVTWGFDPSSYLMALGYSLDTYLQETSSFTQTENMIQSSKQA